jgi:hypothetical protein
VNEVTDVADLHSKSPYTAIATLKGSYLVATELCADRESQDLEWDYRTPTVSGRKTGLSEKWRSSKTECV